MKFDWAPSRTLWHVSDGATYKGRYRVDYVVSLHRVFCRDLDSYGWRFCLGRLRITWKSQIEVDP